MISVDNISKSFTKDKFVVIKDYSTNFKKNTLNIIHGPNGSGKSTLLRLIAGHIYPDKGHVLLDGKIIKPGQVSYVNNNERSFFWRLNVIDNLEFFLKMADKYNDFEYDLLLESFKVKDLLNKPFMSLSSGQKQKINIIRGLACNKDIL
ncbi:MAG: ATP-binding cassette domain-containing protein, partial [Gammaproteobacteria bacterium]